MQYDSPEFLMAWATMVIPAVPGPLLSTKAVTKEISQVCASCIGGGTSTDLFIYTPILMARRAAPIATAGTKSASRASRQLLDHPLFNASGMPMLTVKCRSVWHEPVVHLLPLRQHDAGKTNAACLSFTVKTRRRDGRGRGQSSGFHNDRANGLSYFGLAAGAYRSRGEQKALDGPNARPVCLSLPSAGNGQPERLVPSTAL